MFLMKYSIYHLVGVHVSHLVLYPPLDNDVIISPFNVFFDKELIENHFDSSADSRKSDFDFEKQKN